MRKTLHGFFSAVYLLLKILGLLIHLWSVVIVYRLGGILAAIGVLLVPLLGEILLAIALWIRLGFLNLYTLVVVSFIVTLAITVIMMMATEEEN